jgi:hypothetical protein
MKAEGDFSVYYFFENGRKFITFYPINPILKANKSAPLKPSIGA